MGIALAYLGASLAFALIIAIGSRERRNVVGGKQIFYYQRAILIAFGAMGFLWIFISITVLKFGFPRGEMGLVPFIAYISINALIVLAYFFGYIWYRSYSVEIFNGLVVRSLRHVRKIAFEDVTEANIIEGRDTTRMFLVFGRKKNKLILSGLLVESANLFEEVTKQLLIKGCVVKKRNYVGQWTTLR